MNCKIPVRRVKHGNYILDFSVEDSYCVALALLTDKDRTSTDTNYVTIADNYIWRNAEVNEASGDVIEGSIEEISDFARRAYEEAQAWAEFEIREHAESIILVGALGDVLPPEYRLE